MKALAIAALTATLLPSLAWAQPSTTTSLDANSTSTPATTREEVAAAPAQSESSPYLSDWLTQHINVIGSHGIRFGPKPVDDMYLEYEFMGRKGPWDLYGYIDAPRIFGIGNSNDTGAWNKGSPMFWELEPRLSIDKLTHTKLGFGPFKEFYVAADDIFDWGHNTQNRQHTLYIGLGTDIDTHSPVNLSFNLYGRRQFENYGASNDFGWDGYRAQVKYIWPLTKVWGGALTWVGFTNYDFGSDLARDNPGLRTNHALVSTNVLSLSWTHWAISGVARYFHNGSNWKAGAQLGEDKVKTTGWGEYLILTYSF